jgi:hypothetical protein
MANQGIAPVNLTSTVGLVRVLLGDTDPVNVSGGIGTYLYYSDSEVTALLGLYDDNPKLAAARALETIAASQALLLKSWSSDDLSVRGDQIAKELRDIAKQLRDEASADEQSNEFEIVDFSEEFPTYSWWN